MSAFDLAEFLTPLTPAALGASLVVGLAMGFAMSRFTGRRFAAAHLYWMVAGGTAFYVPVSLVRAFEGSAIWERFLATTILWSVFSLGIFAGTRLRRRV